MGFASFSHWIVVLLIVFIIFGVGNLPKVMGDLGKGIKSFKDGLNGVKPDNHKD